MGAVADDEDEAAGLSDRLHASRTPPVRTGPVMGALRVDVWERGEEESLDERDEDGEEFEVVDGGGEGYGWVMDDGGKES